VQALAALLATLISFAALILLPAWTIDYWQAWIFLAVFGLSSLISTVYLMIKDPRLLERRMHSGPVAETSTVQKVAMSAASIAFIALLVVPGLDHRLHWSSVSPGTAIGGDVLIAIGWAIIFFVMIQNPFASATIELAAGQRVASTGFYAHVRHPMYAAGLLYITGVPIALGSWWGLVAMVLMVPAILLRLLDEERFLVKNLPGYAEYAATVKYRLLPFIW
jgi:protein-S-isoprenylcysteine O-methyltransferase Ste14